MFAAESAAPERSFMDMPCTITNDTHMSSKATSTMHSMRLVK